MAVSVLALGSMLLAGCKEGTDAGAEAPSEVAAPETASAETAPVEPTPTPEPTAEPAPVAAEPAPVVAESAALVEAPPAATDPRFGTCKEAVAAGFGNYVQGVDPEYDWYQDRDHDGVVCEK
ncbi:excalibur calcium-binding domain-containing protein [Cellulomonas sp.]|uniref:excalibur calcium-binding domain-containing protein n=1 Tax=Cellulomonas sp. TaxID=40001 RepID=UPI001B15092D|nr:excalibur calcium-binding domain-containing protein [Cellulomonas sp.]MBO9553971.1 excalibur calcium-binding domain-containing protein [Cellulomonas sp.]